MGSATTFSLGGYHTAGVTVSSRTLALPNAMVACGRSSSAETCSASFFGVVQ